MQVVETLYQSKGFHKKFRGVIRKIKEMYDIEDDDTLQELETWEEMITKAHTDGFNLGLMQGRF